MKECPKSDGAVFGHEELLDESLRNMISLFQVDKDLSAYDISQLVRATRGLIVTNQEIWERQHKNRLVNKDKSPRFQRMSVQSAQCISSNSQTVVNVVHREIREFESLPSFPAVLCTTLAFRNRTTWGQRFKLPDYCSILQQAAYLKDCLVLPFLALFKEYLEAVQVALGEIHAWLLEPDSDIAFVHHFFLNRSYFGDMLQKDASDVLLQRAFPQGSLDVLLFLTVNSERGRRNLRIMKDLIVST